LILNVNNNSYARGNFFLERALSTLRSPLTARKILLFSENNRAAKARSFMSRIAASHLRINPRAKRPGKNTGFARTANKTAGSDGKRRPKRRFFSLRIFLETPQLSPQLFPEGNDLFILPGGDCFRDFALEKEFPLGNPRFERGIDFSDLGLLLIGEGNSWRLLF
jgi:hypothetical protein